MRSLAGLLFCGLAGTPFGDRCGGLGELRQEVQEGGAVVRALYLDLRDRRICNLPGSYQGERNMIAI